MKKTFVTALLLIIVILSTLLVGCGDGTIIQPPDHGTVPPHAGFVSGLFLNITERYIDVGEQVQLSAVFAPLSVENRNVSWSSSDPYIASICHRGRITGLAYGEVTITAVGFIGENEVSATSRIVVGTPDVSLPPVDVNDTPPPENDNVFVPVERITLERNSFFLIVGHSVNLSYTIYPSNATNQTVRWSSNNPAMSIDPDTGVLTALETTTLPVAITVETIDGGHRAQAMATIMTNVVSLESMYFAGTPETITGDAGDTITLTNNVRFVPSNAENQEFRWETTDVSTVSVDNGVLSLHRQGAVIIIARSVENPNIFAQVFVTVTAPPPPPPPPPPPENGGNGSEENNGHSDNGGNAQPYENNVSED